MSDSNTSSTDTSVDTGGKTALPGATAPPVPAGPKPKGSQTKPKKSGASASKKKGGGKAKPRNHLSTAVFARDGDVKALQKSGLFRDGFAVHADSNEYGKNPHERAAELRCKRHQRAYNQAFNLLKKLPEVKHVWACYPTGREESLAKNDNRVKLYREKLYDGDKVRALSTYNEKPVKVRQVVAVVLDCPMVDLSLLFRNLCTQDGELFVIYGGVNLSGQLGYDAADWNTAPATLWKRCVDGSVGSLALGCVTQYRDEPRRAWFDRASGQLTKNICFQHQPLAKEGVAGFLSLLRVIVGRRETVDLPFKLSEAGVLIDEHGFVPMLASTNWGTLVTHSSTCLTAVEFTIDAHIKSANKRLDSTLKEHPLLYAMFRDACTRTVNKLSREERPCIILLPESYKMKAMLTSAKERFSTVPGGDVLAVLSERAKPFELGRRLYEAIRDILKRLMDKFKAWKKGHYTPPPEVAVTCDEEEVSSDSDLTLNVFFSLSKAIDKLARRAANSEIRGFRRMENNLRWMANLLSKPFVLLNDEDEELSYLAKFFLTVGSVVLERFVATCAGSISAFVVAAIELLLVAIAEDTIMGAVAYAAVKALGHLILAILPFWVSLPLHLLIDLFQTGHLWSLLKRIEDTKLGKFLTKVVEKVRTTIRNLRRTWYSTVDHGEAFDDQIGHVELSVARESWTHPEKIPTNLRYQGSPINHSQAEMFYELDKPGRQALPLLQIEELKNVVLTGTSFADTVSCIDKRYSNVAPAPEGCGAVISNALDFLLENTPAVFTSPWTPENFIKKFKEQGHTKAKIKAFERAFRDWQAGILDETVHAVPFSSKGSEILALKVDGSPKTRGVHPFIPKQHVPHILDAYGLKDTFRTRLKFLKWRRPGGEYTWFIHRVEKGSSEEIALRLSLMYTNEICVFTAGDDNYLVIRTRKHYWVIAIDFKSCDSTMQYEALKAIHMFYEKLGFPKAGTASNMDKCTGPRTIMVRFEDYAREFEFTPDYAYNASGTDLTTTNTDTYSAALWCLVMGNWQGDLNLLLPCIEACATTMGIKLVVEKHPDTGNNGLTELGVNTFLSMVPMRAKRAECGFTAIPVSFTKKLIIKGSSQSDKGRSLDFGVVTRIGGSLNSTPYGQRINLALKRHSEIHPFDEVKPARDPSDIYKLQWDSAAIDEDEEFSYLKRLMPNLDYFAYLAEMDWWDTVSSFPCSPGPHELPIFRFLANQHYGYLKDREIRPDG